MSRLSALSVLIQDQPARSLEERSANFERLQKNSHYLAGRLKEPSVHPQGLTVQAVLEKETLSDADIVYLLSLQDPEDYRKLQKKAYERTTELLGNGVYYRGLIEVSNICTSDCRYCGIRKDNHNVSRYTLTQEEIVQAAKFAAANGYGNICLQAGERNDPKFVAFISDCLRAIHKETVSEVLPKGVGVTLSLGDQTKEVYEEWAQASGNRRSLRYLARFESSNKDIFNFLHHTPGKKNKELAHRLQCIEWLRECGYQIGSGVMIGIPGQTLEDLCADIRLFEALDIDMVGMGPYLMSRGGDLESIGQLEQKMLFQLSLNMIAVTRLVLGNVNIASATALQVLHPQGREEGIDYGANVIMPNLTPLRYREGYQLYDHKPGLKDDPKAFGIGLEERIRARGREVGWNRFGSSKKWLCKNSLQE